MITALQTVENTLTSAANAVDAQAAHGLAFNALGAALAFAVLRRKRRRAGVAIVAYALFAAVPGFVAVAHGEGDEPARVERLATSMESFARARGCAAVLRSSCEACDPVARFALAPVAPCASPAPIVLASDALEGPCVERDGTLFCGTSAP
jgi:hypothetical protein